MARTTQRKQPRNPPRKCIFCGEGGTPGNPMTEEHLWPHWMHTYLPQFPGTKTAATRHRLRLGEAVVERKVREGHVFTSRFKLVCKRCNSGWMSSIESDAKPTLIQILNGQRFAILRKNRLALANWIALKVMVTECIDPLDAVINEFERDDFRTMRKIPQRLQIFVATHDVQEWYTGYWHQTLRAYFGSSPPPETYGLGPFKNIQTTALGVGPLFSISFVTTISDLGFDPGLSLRNVRRLWPPRDQPLVWPLPRLSHPEVNRLAHSTRELMNSPISRWLPYPR